MEKLILTKEHFNYNNEYIGKEDITNWKGHIEIGLKESKPEIKEEKTDNYAVIGGVKYQLTEVE